MKASKLWAHVFKHDNVLLLKAERTVKTEVIHCNRMHLKHTIRTNALTNGNTTTSDDVKRISDKTAYGPWL